ncbi:hypothetical protein WICMUC_001792 [Wickerhamomyces mucosus]|uniref:Required for respiratory growth protein 7, mitochondrial n=1 Tax=Wickerhamomyces mucosus TaxID=1378264 RepID=A0A9P8TG67_9ASCO|nr:hypothetical protein WICMUC_001792 [Wickerhamomyces mucosus]
MIRQPLINCIRSKSTSISSLLSYNDLESYFKYAKTTDLRTDSTAFIGTSYELLVLRELTSKFGIYESLHMGGSYDNGIDIQGKWNLNKYRPNKEINEQIIPMSINGRKIKPILERKSSIVDVLIQCKNYSKKITAKEIRELSGIFNFNVPSTKKNKTFSILASPNYLTPQGISQINKVDIPIIYIQFSKLKQISNNDKYDLQCYKGGHLLNFYSNDYARALLMGTNIFFEVQKFIDA